MLQLTRLVIKQEYLFGLKPKYLDHKKACNKDLILDTIFKKWRSQELIKKNDLSMDKSEGSILEALSRRTADNRAKLEHISYLWASWAVVGDIRCSTPLGAVVCPCCGFKSLVNRCVAKPKLQFWKNERVEKKTSRPRPRKSVLNQVSKKHLCLLVLFFFPRTCDSKRALIGPKRTRVTCFNQTKQAHCSNQSGVPTSVCFSAPNGTC